MTTPFSSSARLVSEFDLLASNRHKWVKRLGYYHDEVARYLRFIIPEGSSVVEIGCGIGQLLNAVKPSKGLGIDFSPAMIQQASRTFPHLEFRVDNVEGLKETGQFDYVIISDLLGYLYDIESSLKNVQRLCHPRTRVVITYHNFLWEPLIASLKILKCASPQPLSNWLSPIDVENFLELSGFEVVRRANRMVWPFRLPLVAGFLNRTLPHLPFISALGLFRVVVVRPKPQPFPNPLSVSVVVPCRNEKGNIENVVRRTPQLGAGTEIIFVEGGSTDGTEAEIKRVMALYSDRKLKFVSQGDGKGKADAVRKGFNVATGEMLMILDADLTVPPEELPRFYDALVSRHGEFINGSRLVYPLQKQSMRFLNILGNKGFSLIFTYLLGQRFKDTLCGTKVLLRTDWDKIMSGRSYFGDFDPFGDFDMIFGAAKLNLKIVEVPVHYQDRTYGTTNIQRFTHGWILLRMSFFALRKIKLI
ncbi:MAG: glycosyltransferase [Verrucomicrobiota bacterium]|nr:glycosyltransferase [Verrucomicrobiota bacterium]